MKAWINKIKLRKLLGLLNVRFDKLEWICYSEYAPHFSKEQKRDIYKHLIHEHRDAKK